MERGSERYSEASSAFPGFQQGFPDPEQVGRLRLRFIRGQVEIQAGRVYLVHAKIGFPDQDIVLQHMVFFFNHPFVKGNGVLIGAFPDQEAGGKPHRVEVVR